MACRHICMYYPLFTLSQPELPVVTRRDVITPPFISSVTSIVCLGSLSKPATTIDLEMMRIQTLAISVLQANQR